MAPQGPCPDFWSGFAYGVIQKKLRAVISCQHAVKDNRVDSQWRPKGIIEVIGRTLLKRVFSRPGTQEPEEGLPGLAEENPNGRSKGKVACPCGKQWGPIRTPKAVRDGRRELRQSLRTPKGVKEDHRVQRRSLRSPEAVKEGHRVLRQSLRSPEAVKEDHRVQRRPIGTPKAVKEDHCVLRRSLRSPKAVKEDHCVLRQSLRTPKAVKEDHCVLRQSLRTPKGVKEDHRVQRRPIGTPKAVRDGRREQRGPLCSQMGIKKAAVSGGGRFSYRRQGKVMVSRGRHPAHREDLGISRSYSVLSRQTYGFKSW